MEKIYGGKAIRLLGVSVALCLLAWGCSRQPAPSPDPSLPQPLPVERQTPSPGSEASGEKDPSGDTQMPSPGLEASGEKDPSGDAQPSTGGESPGKENAPEGTFSPQYAYPIPETLSSEEAMEYFYYEPLSQELKDAITGVSYPADAADLIVTYEDLVHLHILHYDFEGKPARGELICNRAIAQDLAEIFYELYQNAYPIEKVRLIDAYGGDDELSMEDNNTSCFNYRVVEGTSHLSNHAYGLAVDINPLYNPYITYDEDHNPHVSPAGGEAYADRSADFPYKIDREDLCYQLFTRHGFTWGGSWHSSQDYQHFQMTP